MLGPYFYKHCIFTMLATYFYKSTGAHCEMLSISRQPPLRHWMFSVTQGCFPHPKKKNLNPQIKKSSLLFLGGGGGVGGPLLNLGLLTSGMWVPGEELKSAILNITLLCAAVQDSILSSQLSVPHWRHVTTQNSMPFLNTNWHRADRVHWRSLEVISPWL